MHAPQHSKKPVLHPNSQLVPSQVENPLAGTLHAVQALPQLVMLVSARHWLPQR
jgi:hypothetical protein